MLRPMSRPRRMRGNPMTLTPRLPERIPPREKAKIKSKESPREKKEGVVGGTLVPLPTYPINDAINDPL